MSTRTETRGEALARHLRKNFAVGGRTRRYRSGSDLHSDMIEAIRYATIYPGCYTEERNEIFAEAWGVVSAYKKHVDGYRIDGRLRRSIVELSPYRFAALLGQMLDAGVQTTGDGERFFSEMLRAL